MNEELIQQMIKSKVQLQQVEAALCHNQENEDLLKLRKDLQEVIRLTKQLLSSHVQTSSSPKGAHDDNHVYDQLHSSWKVGDDCMAIWKKDGQCYKATIEEIDEENKSAVISFANYGNVEVTSLLSLKPLEEEEKLEEAINKAKVKKEKRAKQREYKKKKAWEKAQRAKEIDEQREARKDKWQQFIKVCLKKKKGHAKKSIFASPETVNGKVGIGTCGIADKPMTHFQDNSKYNVRHFMPQ